MAMLNNQRGTPSNYRYVHGNSSQPSESSSTSLFFGHRYPCHFPWIYCTSLSDDLPRFIPVASQLASFQYNSCKGGS